MAYTDQGFNQYLSRTEVAEDIPHEIDPVQLEQVISQIDGSKIVNYNSTSFYFVPTTPPSNPREGEMHYNKTDKKLRVFNGANFETISSG